MEYLSDVLPCMLVESYVIVSILVELYVTRCPTQPFLWD